MIAELPELLAALPPALRPIATIFAVERSVGRALTPDAMLPWVERQFGSADVVAEQTVVRVTNTLTGEESIFNPLRARRPPAAGGDDVALEAWIAAELAGGDDTFADVVRGTTADVFGRVRGQFCTTASNVAKFAGWHGLVIFDEPHPLRFDAARLTDYLHTGLRWFALAHASDARAVFPLLTWNCLPKSGATIVHGHMQLTLVAERPYSRVAAWDRAAETYRADNAGEYADALGQLHDALGLTLVSADRAAVFAHLTPLRDRECVMLAQVTPDVSAMAERLSAAIYPALRLLIDGHGVRSFNLALALPPLDGRAWRLPALARLGDRGQALTYRADLGAMELYGSAVIAADPFALRPKVVHR